MVEKKHRSAFWLLSHVSGKPLFYLLDEFLASIHNIRFQIDVPTLQALLHDARGEEPAALEFFDQLYEAGAQAITSIIAYIDLTTHPAHLGQHQQVFSTVTTSRTREISV